MILTKETNVLFEKAITRCGAPLYVFPMPHLEFISLGILVNAGTSDERANESGMAHALEHMVFQGNVRKPDSKSTSAEIEDTGGSLNAYTSNDFTFYYNTVPDDGLAAGIASVTGLVSGPIFRPENIKTEMNTIVQEIKRAHDDHDSYCYHMFDKLVHGDHPLGKEVLGTKRSVLGFRSDDFRKFHGDFYHPGNFSFIVIGNTTMEVALAEFDRTAESMPAIKKKNVRVSVPHHMPRGKRIAGRDVKQTHIFMGRSLGQLSKPQTQALSLYKAMIGGGMSFPLFQEVRDKRGLCYSIGAHFEVSPECAVFCVNIGTEPARVKEAVACIHDVVNGSCTEELFEKARRAVIGKSKITLSASPENLLHKAVSDLIVWGEPRSPKQLREDVAAVTLADVRNAVETHLIDAKIYSYAYVAPKGMKF